jgi:Zn-dependent protease
MRLFHSWLSPQKQKTHLGTFLQGGCVVQAARKVQDSATPARREETQQQQQQSILQGWVPCFIRRLLLRFWAGYVKRRQGAGRQAETHIAVIESRGLKIWTFPQGQTNTDDMSITPEQLAIFPLWYVAFLLSLTCHEAAHSLVAMWGGDRTAYYSGQVTLNPLPHMRREPFGTILVPLITFFISGSILGWGSAPYDPHWEQRHPKRAALMALAGPAANFLLAMLVVVLIHVGTGMGALRITGAASFSRIVESAGGGAAEGAARFLSILFSLNLLLGCFNLIPVSPLDGHSAIGLLLPEKVFVRWLEFVRSPMSSLLGLLLAWRIVDVIFWPVFLAALGLL